MHISTATDICRLKTAQKHMLQVGRHFLTAVSITSMFRAPDKMRICVFHSNLNVKNSIIFGNVRIMYAKHFPDTQLCPVSKPICFVYILMECGLLPIFP